MSQAFVARQPIFDRQLKVYAYELLFRSSNENMFTHSDGDYATSSIISDSFLLFGVDELTRGRKVFINFTQNLLMDETATILPKNLLVIEILETIVPDRSVISACRKLKDLGYVLALDDFVFDERFQPLIELADIIKVDFLVTSPEDRRRIIERWGRKNLEFLAEKVETQEEFQEAKALGYSYFQGYFFSKPVVLSRKDIPAYKLTYLSILHEINQPDVDFNKIETAIKRDVSISYKLLKFINSSFFGFAQQIHSIKQALLMLGTFELRKWVSLIIMKGMGQEKPEELLVISIVRARLCELVGTCTGNKERSSDLFFMGLFSMIDTFMDQPMAEVLQNLPLADEPKQALLGKGGTFHDILELVLAYEQVDWQQVSDRCAQVGLDQFAMADHYVKAIEWANTLLSV